MPTDQPLDRFEVETAEQPDSGDIPHTPEEQERAAAIRRGEERERARAAGILHSSHTGVARAWSDVAAVAFAALAENVRDYAIFLMDTSGTIIFWGEGARLMKWWSKDQAEGAHLRM